MSLSLKNSLLAHGLRRGRWQLRRAAATLKYGPQALQSSPILFGNSVPKSGTHLLAQILSAFPQIGLAVDRGMGPILTFERQSGRERTVQELLHELGLLGPADICFGHIVAEPEIRSAWQAKNIAHFFMLRDPRDVVISHAFYITDKAVQNVHHEYYMSLESLDERIQVSILGRPDWHGEGEKMASFPDINARFARYQDWLDEPGVCILHFEQFLQNRQENLNRILDYAIERGFHLYVDRDEAIQRLETSIQPKKSFTFRKGEAGNWREHFTAQHKELFKQMAGELLIRLGYERDLNW